MQFSLPSILSSFNQWGAFLFFGAWCLVAIIYTFLMIPEVSGLTVEEIEETFKGSWFNAYQTSRHRQVIEGRPGAEAPVVSKIITVRTKSMDGEGKAEP
ncbi:hypothetical protein PFICI_00482 [Pestalotiopsis fici W106-1]|uniref:Major facilitator superfamily (MFS) profile domain-containing protein n=1 Tax=Pestalotiopsis fici (strain W106-1 / CGMCC3.15140) TaxID=1229662 RepID=W3XKW8_PESFW|nr:uncharacterized protein PFICI_00482 [Pestalotiopsis fici W106-1]ETS86654.1 hypothetical protein PFICI_00482 [Pestalotiopsis fici W106-1]